MQLHDQPKVLVHLQLQEQFPTVCPGTTMPYVSCILGCNLHSSGSAGYIGTGEAKGIL